jgi:hypothetical protein
MSPEYEKKSVLLKGDLTVGYLFVAGNIVACRSYYPGQVSVRQTDGRTDGGDIMGLSLCSLKPMRNLFRYKYSLNEINTDIYSIMLLESIRTN